MSKIANYIKNEQLPKIKKKREVNRQTKNQYNEKHQDNINFIVMKITFKTLYQNSY